ncbi:MAG: hypothetical protein ABJE47_24925 [bacterium]
MAIDQLYPVGNVSPGQFWATPLVRREKQTFAPTKAADAGPLSASCAYCGETIIVDISAAALSKCSVHCEYCGMRSVGAEHPHAAK